LLVRLAKLVTAAEASGAQYPRDSVTTSPARRCVDATGAEAASSGEFEAAFFQYARTWRSGYGKIAWRPARPALGDSLVVRIQRLGDSIAAVFFRSAHPIQSGNGDVFYPSAIHLPASGDWLIVATAGKQWGCFALSLAESQ
jgi:hypothetical protein